MKATSYKSKREDVMSYTHLIAQVSQETGLKKAQVRQVLEAAQRNMANFVRDTKDGRVHFGRLMTVYSRMTGERIVNHPQKPGERLVSAPHLVLRIDVGSHTKSFLAGEIVEWDSGKEEVAEEIAEEASE